MNSALPRFALVLIAVVSVAKADWPQHRGPGGQGQSNAADLPREWSESKNVTWKTPIPGLGWSSPVLSNGKLYLTTAVPKGGGNWQKADRTLFAICVDAATGKIDWNMPVFYLKGADWPAIHKKNSHASATPVVEGDRIYFHYGYQGTACLDTWGKLKWRTIDLRYTPVHGSGGSPIIVGDKLIFGCDGRSEAFLAAIDKRNGKTLWKTDRETDARRKFSFATPLAVEVGGKTQIISPCSGAVIAYEPERGRELWRVDYDQGYSVVPRPVAGHGMVFVSSGYDRAIVHAIKLDSRAKGDVTDTHLVWDTAKSAPKNASMLVVGDELYFVADNGVATCADAKTGDVHWSERVGSTTSASPLHNRGLIYFQDEQGTCTVVRAGKRFQKVAVNKLPGRIFASYAVDEQANALFIRSEKALYRIEEK